MTEQMNQSQVVYFTRLHWVVFFGPVLGLFISLAIGFIIPELVLVSYTLSIFNSIWILITWVSFYFSSITIQTKSVILRTGIIVRQTIDIPMDKIETIDIRQSILGSLFHYGTLIITGTGGTKHFINFLSAPLTCRRYIEQMMNQR